MALGMTGKYCLNLKLAPPLKGAIWAGFIQESTHAWKQSPMSAVFWQMYTY